MLSPRGRDKVVTLIEAYCDESGIHDGARACAVVGWVATARTWQRFEERWLKASAGVEWHGKDFFARDADGQRVRPYKGWSDNDALDYVRALVEAITASHLQAVGGLVDVQAFKALSLDERKWLTGATWNNQRQRFTTTGSPNRPYYLGFMECLEGAASNVKKHGWQVSFVFDQQNQFAPWALLFFQAAKKQTQTELSTRLGDITFKSKVGVGGLQAADMLAHTLYRVFTEPFTGINLTAPELMAITTQFDSQIKNRIASYHKRGLAMRLSDRRRYVRGA
jgi:hypothetical protein